MKVNFLLPISIIPSGGAKVIFEYANRLALDGKKVTIIYPTVIRYDKANSPSFFTWLKMIKKVFTKKIKKKYSAKSWFKLNPAIREKLVPCLKEKFIPDANTTFATAVETAAWLNTYSPAKGKKMYLIQHFEDWNSTKEEVDDTWKMPFFKIVISRWLHDYAASLNEKSVIINNGLDFTMYNIDEPVEARDPFQLIMLYHHFGWKGSADGIKAIAIAKEKNPAIQLILFGTVPRPKDIPAWVEYHQNPVILKDLYNRAAIFLSPSWGEGWALPPAEAMQCGCACILTDIGGHRDYGICDKDLLLVPVKNAGAMARSIHELTTNINLRIDLAKSGNSTIQQFTWEKAYQKLKPYLHSFIFLLLNDEYYSPLM